jgi:alpha-glucosidase
MTWWHDAVVYQIYPRSFCDTNGDGVGDLNGIRERLLYLSWLGIDALWLSPMFTSPMRDFGYDVSNYVDIDPLFGTLDDFDHLVREAHALDIRVVLDWVPNHTSIDHPWFLESRSSRSSSQRDWYIWRDAPENGGLPNNWIAAWSDQPAWTWDEQSGQYYLHMFLESQPDLNWANPQVRDAMHETLRFWLDRGVDGIRMDVVHALGKEVEKDDPEELRLLGHTPLNDVAVTHEYLREIRSVFDEYEGDRVSIGEVYLLDPRRVASYYGNDDELHLSFNFASMFTAWRASSWLQLVEQTERVMSEVNAWPTWVLSNHDNPRIATRLGGQARVRAALVLLLCLRGTPFLYAGEELGLEDAVIASESAVDPGGRDGCRSPMPWTPNEGHGWPSTPWLPFSENASASSVQSQYDDANSTLQFAHRLLKLRKETPALQQGALENLHLEGDVLVFDRVDKTRRVRVMINFAKVPSTVALTRWILLRSSDSKDGTVLEPNEAVVLFASDDATTTALDD